MKKVASQPFPVTVLLLAFCASLLAFPTALQAADDDGEKIKDKTVQIFLQPFEVPLAKSKRKINVTVFVEAKGQDKQYLVCQMRARIRDAVNTELWNRPMGTVIKEAEPEAKKKGETKAKAKAKAKSKKRPRKDLNIPATEKRLYSKVNRATGKRKTISKVYVLKGKVEPKGQDKTFKHRRLTNPVTCGRINFREKGIK